MSFFNNMKIRSKILFALTAPVLALLYFSLSNVWDKSRISSDMKSLDSLATLASNLNSVVHETQKERGITAMYLGSNEETEAGALEEQRSQTKEQVAELQGFLSEFDADSFGADFAGGLARVKERLGSLDETRTAVSARKLSLDEAITWYSQTNAEMLDTIGEMSELINDVVATNLIHSYANFLQSKERAGIERAVLAGTFTAGQFAPGMYQKFSRLVAEQDTFIKVFLKTAKPENADLFREKMQNPVVAETTQMREIAFAGAGDEKFQVDPKQWFTAQTKKINLLKDVEDHMSKNLASTAAALKSKATFSLFGSLAVTIGVLAASLFIALFIAQRISKAVDQTVTVLDQVASGDLTEELEIHSNDEFGQIATSLNKATDSLRTAEFENSKKSAMIENAPVNIILADEDLNITYVNPATAKALKPLSSLLPVPVDQVVGSNVDIFHKNPAYQRGILNDPKNLPHRAVIELGDQRLDLLVTAIVDDKGDYIGPMVTWENITEKIAAEQREKLQAEQIKEQAESLQKTIDQLLAEIGGLVDASREGRLSVRANADLFEGGFADMVRGVNETIDSILTPVNEAAATLEKIAAQDLTARMSGDYQGDHAALKDNLNKAVERLDQALSQVAQTVEQVNSSSNEIATGSQSLAQGAQEQASSLEEISSSLEEMASMTKQNADNSNQAKLLSGEAQTSADRGNDSMEQMTEAIDKIKASSDQTAKIVKTIDEIAFQTNLLALNAAVEAARAGEAGKGFAVVAEEVRNLAQRSAEAAKNTADMIEESVKNAEGGVRITEEVAKVLGEIGEGSRKVNDLVAEIAAASNEQSQGIEQVNTAVAQLDKVTQQNAANSEESSSAAQSLSGQAGELGSLVATFELSERSAESRPDVAARNLAQEVGQVARQKPQAQPQRQLTTVGAGSSSGTNGHGKSPEKVLPLDDEDFGDF